MEEERCLHHVYMQCMKNQSANLGTYTIDGCGEFVPDNDGFFCAACGCHRSFHHKVPAASTQLAPSAVMPAAHIDNQSVDQKPRRVRTKFTAEQKEKMGSFAEKIGWRISKRGREEKEEVDMFLVETGVSWRAFKVWMHNHRNTATQVQTAADSSGTETDDSVPAVASGINDNVYVEVSANGNHNAYTC